MNHLKISTRLTLGFAAITFAFLVLSAFTAWRMHQVSQATARMEMQTQLLDLAEKWQANTRQNSARTLAVAYSPGTVMHEFFKADMAATTEETTVTQKKFLELAKEEDTLKQVQTVNEARKVYLVTRDEALSVKETGDGAGAQELVRSKFAPAVAAYIGATQTLVDGQFASVGKTRDDINAIFSQLYVVGGLCWRCASALRFLRA